MESLRLGGLMAAGKEGTVPTRSTGMLPASGEDNVTTM